MNLHTEFYDLRDKCWKALEEMVRTGAKIDGDLPIVIGEYTLAPSGLRTNTTCFPDYCDIIITEIIANPNYQIFPDKISDKDIHVTTNTFKVKLFSLRDEEVIVEVEPDLNNIQTLSTLLSGGYSVYNT